jgi:hypothetical protein
MDRAFATAIDLSGGGHAETTAPTGPPMTLGHMRSCGEN